MVSDTTCSPSSNTNFSGHTPRSRGTSATTNCRSALVQLVDHDMSLFYCNLFSYNMVPRATLSSSWTHEYRSPRMCLNFSCQQGSGQSRLINSTYINLICCARPNAWTVPGQAAFGFRRLFVPAKVSRMSQNFCVPRVY